MADETTEHFPTEVWNVEGMPFVRCSCSPNNGRPQSAVWLQDHWQGDEASGIEALKAVVRQQGGHLPAGHVAPQRPEPTAQAGREALSDAALADVKAVLADNTTPRQQLRAIVARRGGHAVATADDILAAGFVPPANHAAVLADRGALQRRLDEAEAKVRRLEGTAVEWCTEEDRYFDPKEGHSVWVKCTKSLPHAEHEDTNSGHTWTDA